MDEKDGAALAWVIRNNAICITLDLFVNEIFGAGVLIGQALADNTKLKSLDLQCAARRRRPPPPPPPPPPPLTHCGASLLPAHISSPCHLPGKVRLGLRVARLLRKCFQSGKCASLFTR